MAVRNVQMRFTAGELDPLLYARGDTEFYYSGAEKMRNVICLPEGGYKRRPGLKHIDRLHRKLERDTTPVITAPHGGTAANANDNDATTFLTTTTNIGTVNPYVVVHYDLGASKDIAVIDIVACTLTTQTNDTEFFIQVSEDDTTWVTIGDAIPLSTTPKTIRKRVRGNYRYARFVRIGNTDLGTDKVSIGEFNVWIEQAETSLAKRVDFKFNIDQTYIIFFTDKNISIYRNGNFLTDVRAASYTSDNMQTLNSTQTADTALIFHEDVTPHRLMRIDDMNWTFEPVTFEYIPRYNFVRNITNPAGTLTPSALSGKITLTASVGLFTAASVGQFLEGNGGRVRITKYTSATVVEGIALIPFYNTSAIATGDWEFDQGWEDVWSNARGWPRSAAFFQQRLWLGGSKSRPRTLWSSVIGDFYNFDPGSLRDSDAIDYDLDEDDPIVNIVANRSLQIFTTGGEAAIIQSRIVPITPTNPSIVSQTKIGSEPGIKPLIVDGATLFLQREGQSIGQFLFSEAEQSYTVTNVSLLSSHLIVTPVDIALRKSTSNEEASYLLIVNSDGTLTFGCMLAEQNVRGFSLQTTDGNFKNTAVDGSSIYAVVERTVEDVPNNYLEQFDFSFYTDAAVQVNTGLPAETFTGLDHLNGKECRVRADGYVLPNVTPEDGSATLPYTVQDLVEFGLNFNTEVVTLPYENPQVVGVTMGKMKRISEVTVRMKDTESLKVNNNLVSFRSFNLATNPLNQPTQPFSGDKRIQGIRGWDLYGKLTLTQVDPMPMTILAISMKVTV